jgi:hypothetical protein
MLPEEMRDALLIEIHRSVEESATQTAGDLVGSGKITLSYPPNNGLTAEEAAALKALPAIPQLESAFRKVIADAAFYPMFNLMSLIDGVADPVGFDGDWAGVRLKPMAEGEDEDDESSMLHDDIYESYWTWREQRPNPGWRLDTLEDE